MFSAGIEINHCHEISSWVNANGTVVKEAVIGRCSSKKMFLKISKVLQESTCVGFSF